MPPFWDQRGQTHDARPEKIAVSCHPRPRVCDDPRGCLATGRRLATGRHLVCQGCPVVSSERSRGVVGVGYEGRDAEQFVRDLDSADIAVVVDVRLNPISRKKGFSKRTLAEHLAAAGIGYEHLPALGNLRLRGPRQRPAGGVAHHHRGEIGPGLPRHR